MRMALHLSTADVIHYVDVYFNGDIKTEFKTQLLRFGTRNRVL